METLLQTLLTLLFCQGVLLLIPPIVIKTKNKLWLRGATARNNPLIIWINPEQEYYDAVLAQERYECETRKWLHLLVKWYVSKDYKREIELMGRSIEIVIVTNGMSKIAAERYLHVQSLTLIKNYAQFKGYSVDEVKDMIYKTLPKAETWVKENVN